MATTPTIDAAPDHATLCALVEEALGTTVESAEPAGKGLLGYVFRVALKGAPYKVVVKWQKYGGRAEPETRQLDVLRSYASVKVPEVLYVHKGSPEIPAEAMIMELVPGIQASSLDDPPMDVQERIAEEAVEILLQWHSVVNPEGYGKLDGPFHKRWADYMKPNLAAAYDAMLMEVSEGEMPPILPRVAERSLEAIEDILGIVEGPAVLVHGDFWLPNLLIDPETYRITGVLDPLDVRWDEPEVDVVPMDWPWGDYKFLMNAYERRRPLRDGWPLRFKFQRFWFMLQAVFLLGPKCAVGEAEELEKAMDESL